MGVKLTLLTKAAFTSNGSTALLFRFTRASIMAGTLISVWPRALASLEIFYLFEAICFVLNSGCKSYKIRVPENSVRASVICYRLQLQIKFVA